MATKKVYAIEEDCILAPLKNVDQFDPQKIGAALERLRIKDGEIRPERALEEARDPSHPFHAHVEWDDKKAAHAHRLDQIRCLIRVVRVETADAFHRAFVSLPSANGGKSYVSLAQVLGSVELRASLLQQAESELSAWKQRYRELHDIVELVQPAIEAIAKRRKPRGGDEPRPSA